MSDVLKLNCFKSLKKKYFFIYYLKKNSYNKPINEYFLKKK